MNPDAILARARLRAQRGLEQSASPGPLALAAARLYGGLVRVERPLRVSVPVLCVGGATLGGSGKTPLAIAAARALAESGRRVALVGHAYRARPGRARFVARTDAVDVVGDEALEAACALDGTGARVVVAPTRQAAVDFVARTVDVLVLDGPLQLSPQRARLSWLAVDSLDPWGRGACPPAGDLRAPKAALLGAADRVVPVRGTSRGVWDGDVLLDWPSLRDRRVGLVTSVARPERIVTWLGRHGVTPLRVLVGPDHGPLPSPRDPRVQLWLTTGKDWALLASRRQIARIDYHLRLPVELAAELGAAFPLCATVPNF